MSLSSVLKRSVSPLSKLNIAIVGNVASGKTTVANIIFDTLKDQVECIQPCRELVANKYNSFANFFADVMVHALQDDQTYQKKDIRLCNRYFDSVYHEQVVYAKEKRFISEEYFRSLTRLYNHQKSQIRNKVHLIIWVDTQPEKCYERSKATGNLEFSLGKITDLDKIYREWLGNVQDVPVVRIDGNGPKEKLEEFAAEFAVASKMAIENHKEERLMIAKYY